MEQIVDTHAYQRIASDAMNRERNYPNLVASDYYWHRKRREVADLVRRNRKKIPESGLFVELGAGEGRDVWAIRDAMDKPGMRFVCAEASLSDLELANARKAYHGIDEVEFRPLDITGELPWADDSVDFIYSSEVFEHIPKIDDLVAETTRVLKKGGFLLLTTPNQPNLFQRSFYSRKRREEITRRNAKPKRIAEDGTPLYGHVTLKKNSEWDALMAAHGLHLADHGRGSVWYGVTPFYNRSGMLALQFALNGFLDMLPRGLTRNISDQVIALYRKR